MRAQRTAQQAIQSTPALKYVCESDVGAGASGVVRGAVGAVDSVLTNVDSAQNTVRDTGIGGAMFAMKFQRRVSSTKTLPVVAPQVEPPDGADDVVQNVGGS